MKFSWADGILKICAFYAFSINYGTEESLNKAIYISLMMMPRAACIVLGCQYEVNCTTTEFWKAVARAKELDINKGAIYGLWPYQWKSVKEEPNKIFFWPDYLHRPRLVGVVTFTQTATGHTVHYRIYDRTHSEHAMPIDNDKPLYEVLHNALMWLMGKQPTPQTVEVSYDALASAEQRAEYD